ncbi:FecCD family ABC transporter permease [Salinibius halmophilus]|uniref:FecCD family ABC transporter permease n=1 Tax=Salinibius halmophilus TaxID=1853216 RepID=UPI000E66157D|nr:iron ABC transporter permease [Salinibius halmophilus]
MPAGKLLFIATLIALAAMVLTALAIGGAPLALSQVIYQLGHPFQGDTPINNIIWQLRVPRVLLGIISGALLGICGATAQGIFRNPLAEPGLIGVTAGGSLGAVIVIVFWTNTPLFVLPLAAFVGGLLATQLAVKVAKLAGNQTITLILAGLAINIIAGAGVGIAAYFADANQLRLILFWNLGSLASASWYKVLISGALLIAVVPLIWQQWRLLNALLLGESEARHLGFAVQKQKKRLIIWMSAGVAGAVAFTGTIGFIGLIVPHIVRLLVGPDHRWVLPISATIGATFLLLTDLIARSLFSPLELPLGILTALIGGPIFIWLLVRQYRRSMV